MGAVDVVDASNLAYLKVPNIPATLTDGSSIIMQIRFLWPVTFGADSVNAGSKGDKKQSQQTSVIFNKFSIIQQNDSNFLPSIKIMALRTRIWTFNSPVRQQRSLMSGCSCVISARVYFLVVNASWARQVLGKRTVGLEFIFTSLYEQDGIKEGQSRW